MLLSFLSSNASVNVIQGLLFRARDFLCLIQTCICLRLLWIGNWSSPTLYVRPYQCEKNTLLCVQLFLNTHSNLNPSLTGYGLPRTSKRFKYYHNRLLIRLLGIWKECMSKSQLCVRLWVWLETPHFIIKCISAGGAALTWPRGESGHIWRLEVLFPP